MTSTMTSTMTSDLKVFFTALVTLSISFVSTPALGEGMFAKDPLSISRSVLDTRSEAPIENSGYLSLIVPYAPVKNVYEQIQERLGLKLITRGEAHVTVVTPPELVKLAKKVTIADINAIAARRKIQESDLKLICVGEGRAKVAERDDRTYFIVVRSRRLLSIRKEIEKLFLERGGEPAAFRATEFHPHITVGFTTADLHIHQGVVKDKKSCLFGLRLTKPQ